METGRISGALPRSRGRAGIVAGAALAAFLAGSPAGAIVVNHGPWLSNPTDTTLDITWTTDVNAVSRVFFGEAQTLGKEAYRARHGLIDFGVRLHSVRLKGLKPGTRYHYKLLSKEVVAFDPYSVQYGGTVETPVLTFTTLDRQKQNFSFVTMSDIHGNAASHDQQLKAVQWADVDFVAYTGDMIDYYDNTAAIGSNRGDDQIFKGWLDVAVANYAKQKPMVYLMGNHEPRGDRARDMDKMFPTHVNGEYYYSFNHGRVHFMILHSGEDKEDCNPSYGCGSDGIAWMNAFLPYREQEAAWLRQDVQSPEFRNATCRILLMHIPLSSGYAGQEMRRLWQPILEANRIDAMLVGHTHSTGYKPRAGNVPAELMNSKTSTIRVDVTAGGARLTLTELDGSKVNEFTACQDATGLGEPERAAPAPLLSGRRAGGTARFSVPAAGAYELEIHDTRGQLVLRRSGTGPDQFEASAAGPGVYTVKMRSGGKSREAFNIQLME